jgi:hypothetical protein
MSRTYGYNHLKRSVRGNSYSCKSKGLFGRILLLILAFLAITAGILHIPDFKPATTSLELDITPMVHSGELLK